MSFLAIIAAMAVMGAYAFVLLDRMDGEAANMRDSTVPQLSYSSQLLASWNENYALTQELVMQQDSSELDQLSGEIRSNRSKVADLVVKYETVATGEGANLPGPVMALLAEYQGVQDKILKAAADIGALPAGPASSLQRSALVSQAIAMLHEDLKPQYEKARDAIENMVKFSNTTAGASAVNIAKSGDAAKTGIIVAIAVGLVLAVVSGLLLLRAVTRPLGWLVGVMDRIREGDFTERVERRDEFKALGESFNRMADELAALFGRVQKSGNQVDASVTQIAATAKEQQATASEIAATTTQIGATSKEISATSRELVRTMSDVATVAEGTAALAGNGQAGLARMEDTMHQVVQAAGSINSKLAVLNEKAGNINQVVTTITKVADQTNLLSLNAAIEAEKAGEYGRGFAVVASEIRRLADQTAVATYDIEQMVKDIQSAVSAGVMGMDKFSEEVRRGMDDVHQVGTQLTQIIAQVQALVPRFEMANEGMQAQATGAEQITEALLQLTEAAQQTVESLRQSTMAIDELNHVSTTLRSSVSRVKLAAA